MAKWDRKSLNRICGITSNNPKHVETIIKMLAHERKNNV